MNKKRSKKVRFKLTQADMITLTRLGFAPVVIGLFLLGYNFIAAGFYYLGALTDALDGYVARRYKQVTSYGGYLDALVDRLFLIPIIFTLAMTGILKLWVVSVMILLILMELGMGFFIHKKLKKSYLYFVHRNSIRAFAFLIYIVFGLYMIGFIYADYVFIAAIILGIISFFDYSVYIKNLKPVT